MDSPKNVLLIGITNRKDILDPALLRSGRLEYHLEIPLPNEVARKYILDVYLNPLTEKGLVGDIDTNKWAQKLEGYAGADIENLVNKAKNLTLRRNLRFINFEKKTNNDPAMKSSSAQFKANSSNPVEGQTISSIMGDQDLEAAFTSFKPVSMVNKEKTRALATELRSQLTEMMGIQNTASKS